MDATCQQFHGDQLKYAITDSLTQRASSEALNNFEEFSICHDGQANCTFPATKIDGLEVEKNLFIRAYFDGIIDVEHSKLSTLFTTYRCGIDLIKSSITFESAVISPEEHYITFSHWTYTTTRCQAEHGHKTKYAISSERNSTKALECVAHFAECTTAECKFKAEECVKSQEANIVACFDGLNSDTVCTEENSKHSNNFEIIKIGASDCNDNSTHPLETADIFAHSQKFAVPVDDWKPLKIKI